jgi:hypothetical protein
LNFFLTCWIKMVRNKRWGKVIGKRVELQVDGKTLGKAKGAEEEPSNSFASENEIGSWSLQVC